MSFNARTGAVNTAFHPKFTGQTGADPRTARSTRSSAAPAAPRSGSAASSRRSNGRRRTAAWCAGTCATNKLFTAFKPRDRRGRQDRPGLRREVLLRPAVGRRRLHQRRRRQPHRAGQPRPQHRRRDQPGQPRHQRHRGGHRRPDPGHQDRAEPELQACRASSATSPRSPGTSATRSRCSTCPTTGVASLAPWYSLTHLRASQPGPSAPSAVRGTALPVWTRDVDWAPDGTWWALGRHRRQHGRTRRCATRSAAGPTTTAPTPGRCGSTTAAGTRSSASGSPASTCTSAATSGCSTHAVYRNGDKVGFDRPRALRPRRHRRHRPPAGCRCSGWNDGVDHRPRRRLGRDAGRPRRQPARGSGLWVGGDSGLIKGETGKRVALLPVS